MAEKAPKGQKDPDAALAVHPVYKRAKEMVREELKGRTADEVNTKQVREKVIEALRGEFPKLADRIKDEGMLAQDISDEISAVRIKAGFSESVDKAAKDLGL